MTDESKICTCTTPEYTINLEKQGPPGVKGETGENGFSPVITVAQNTPTSYILNILTADGMTTTPNLKANLPAGGATGQVLTKNSGEQDDCSWQNLPNATTEVEGIARLATETDFETTEDSSVSDTSIVTPALFNSELEKQSANFVTRGTVQSIDATKLFQDGLSVYNNLTIPYNSSRQNGKIVTNATFNGVRIPIVEPYDSNGSFRIGAVKEEASKDIQNGFDINNDWANGTQGVTYYEVGQKGKLVASFNIDNYVKAGDNVTIDKGSDGSLTINSLKNSGGDFIPIEGDVNNIIGTKNLTAGGYIGLTQPLGCGISAGGATILTYSSDRVGTANYFNPIIGSAQSKYTQINSPYLRGSDGTRFVKQTDYATTSTGGTVKVDGTTITINDGVISTAVNELDLQAVKDEIASTTNVANNVSEALNGFKFVETTEEQYNASDAHDANTLYRTTDTNKVYLGTIQLSN